MNDFLLNQLRKIAYVKKGNGSSEGMVIVQVKEKTDENIEAVELLLTLASKVDGSYGLYYVKF